MKTTDRAPAPRAATAESGPLRPEPTPPAARRVPSTPRERKPLLAALAVLLIAGGALASGLLVVRSGNRVSVIAVSAPVAAGQRIPLGALTEVQVSADSAVRTVPWAQREQVTAFYAKVGLVPGTLLTPAMATEGTELAAGKIVVGLALKPGQLPAGGMRAGEYVRVFAVGGSGEGEPTSGGLLAAQAVVYHVASSGEDVATGDTTLVSIAVGPNEAARVAAAASAGRVAIALLPPGSVLPDGAIDDPAGSGRADSPGGSAENGRQNRAGNDPGNARNGTGSGAPPSPDATPGSPSGR